MADDRKSKAIEEIERMRDELKVRMHLAAAEVRQEWDVLEKKWQHLRGRSKRVGEVAGDAAEDVGDALALLGDELKKGYARIRAML